MLWVNVRISGVSRLGGCSRPTTYRSLPASPRLGTAGVEMHAETLITLPLKPCWYNALASDVAVASLPVTTTASVSPRIAAAAKLL